MPRAQEELQMDSGARMDTYNDDEDSYGEDDDGAAGKRFGDLADGDRLSVDLDDLEDQDSEEEPITLG